MKPNDLIDKYGDALIGRWVTIPLGFFYLKGQVTHIRPNDSTPEIPIWILSNGRTWGIREHMEVELELTKPVSFDEFCEMFVENISTKMGIPKELLGKEKDDE